MVRDRDEPPAVRVYTVCDESRYLIVRNVPALGCGDDLSRLFGSYGEIEECKPMDAEDCDPFTDVYWIKFSQVSNARFAKRKLDESVFLGNLLKVSYAPQFESVLDVKEKLEGRTREVLGRIKSANVRTEGSKSQISSNSTIIGSSCQHWLDPAPSASSNSELQGRQREFARGGQISHVGNAPLSHVSSNKEYFPTPSMNETVRLVREKLDKIQSRSGNTDTASASKRAKVDNRRRI
uniref:RNA-binding protein 48 n=1 Tax=Musa acuminata subsp. malaccensis TaxID=214687 RepID=A0A804HP92_MUSAM|nr:PREDICTED: RNA-binding protein 48 [Musa acuminata subsp. malaccensis]